MIWREGVHIDWDHLLHAVAFKALLLTIDVIGAVLNIIFPFVCIEHHLINELRHLLFLNRAGAVDVEFLEKSFEFSIAELEVLLEVCHVFAYEVPEFILVQRSRIVKVVTSPDLVDNDFDTIMNAAIIGG